MASHFAADLSKTAGIHTEVFFDLSLITAISNDIGYEHIFSLPLRQRAKKGDMLIAISSSGNSANILKAVEVAVEMGITVVTLTGMSRDNLLRTRGSLNVYVPTTSYGHTETCHALILHYWMDRVATPLSTASSKSMLNLIQTVTLTPALENKTLGA